MNSNVSQETETVYVDNSSMLRNLTGNVTGVDVNDSETEESLTTDFCLPCTVNFPYECPVTVIVLLIVLLGIIGNTAVLVAMKRQRLYKKTSHMCILILALSDILALLVNIAREFVFYPNIDYFDAVYGFPEAFCIVFFVLVYSPYIFSSVNVVFMAYERYVLVTNPLVYHETHTAQRAACRALIALIVILIINLIYAIIMSDRSECPDYLLHSEYYAFISVPLIVFSSFLLMFFHCVKMVKLSKSQSMKERYTINMRKYSRMTKIVYIIVIIYILSQIPYVVYDIVSTCETFELIEWSEENYETILEVGIVIFPVNYAVNPFIYWLTPVNWGCRVKSSSFTCRTSCHCKYPVSENGSSA